MSSAADPAKEDQVLELRRAGVTFDRIADQVGYSGKAAARRAYQRALERTGQVEADELRSLELDRMDRLHAALWAKALKGDLNAVDRVLRISERRDRLTGIPVDNAHELRRAFDESVATSGELEENGVDQGIIAAGQKLADRIDAAVALGEGQEVTKALYLMPHLVNILREMNATPAAREAVEEAKPTTPNSKLEKLRAIPKPA